MRAGRLDQIVELQRSEVIEDEVGQEIHSWITFDKVWAGIEGLKASEPFAEDQINSVRNVKIIMRYRNDTDTTCRISHTDRGGLTRIYEITGQPVQAYGHGYSAIQFNARQLHAGDITAA